MGGTSPKQGRRGLERVTSQVTSHLCAVTYSTFLAKMEAALALVKLYCQQSDAK
jgi:hypothetical protein